MPAVAVASSHMWVETQVDMRCVASLQVLQQLSVTHNSSRPDMPHDRCLASVVVTPLQLQPVLHVASTHMLFKLSLLYGSTHPCT